MIAAILDTHIAIWSRTDRSRLSLTQRTALDRLEKGGRTVGISDITIWEIALAHSKGRLEVDSPLEEWLFELETHPFVRVLPLDSRIVIEATCLGDDLHRDP